MFVLCTVYKSYTEQGQVGVHRAGLTSWRLEFDTEIPHEAGLGQSAVTTHLLDFQFHMLHIVLICIYENNL